MRRFLLLLFLAVPTVTFLSYRSPAEYHFDAFPKPVVQPAKYWSAPIDSVFLEPRYSYEEPALRIYTRHNPEKLIAFLNDSLGQALYEKPTVKDDFSFCGTYKWQLPVTGHHSVQLFQIEIREEWDGFNAFSIMLFLFDKSGHNRADETRYRHAWTNLLDRFLFTQPHVAMKNTAVAHFQLTSFFNWNEDSLFNIFTRFMKDPDDHIYAHVRIGHKGEIEEVRCSPADSALEKALRCLPEKGYPVLIENRTGDTTTYELEWTLHQTRLNQLKYYEQQLNGSCSDCTRYEDSPNGFDFMYENRILKGHLFQQKKEHALFHVYGQPETFLYEKTNGRWIFADSIHAGDKELYDIFFAEELDGQPFPEVGVRTCRNSNGNSWAILIRYDTLTKQLSCGGHFNTSYKPDFSRHELLTEYGGSWYMPTYREIQKWVNGKLVAYKKVEIALKEATMESDERIMTEYYNPWWKTGKDTLIPIRMQRYTGSAAQEKVYDLFGGRNIYDPG